MTSLYFLNAPTLAKSTVSSVARVFKSYLIFFFQLASYPQRSPLCEAGKLEGAISETKEELALYKMPEHGFQVCWCVGDMTPY
jgi:hypothetical protein